MLISWFHFSFVASLLVTSSESKTGIKLANRHGLPYAMSDAKFGGYPDVIPLKVPDVKLNMLTNVEHDGIPKTILERVENVAEEETVLKDIMVTMYSFLVFFKKIYLHLK